jgi:hypothetical protein
MRAMRRGIVWDGSVARAIPYRKETVYIEEASRMDCIISCPTREAT